MFAGIRALTSQPLHLQGDSAFVYAELEAYEFAMRNKNLNMTQVEDRGRQKG